MQVMPSALKPLQRDALSGEEQKILGWLRQAVWEPQKGEREPIPYKAKVPEFYLGVRLLGSQGAAGNLGALERLLKKLEYQGVISKQDMYPVGGHGALRTVALKKADLDNLGVGAEEEDE